VVALLDSAADYVADQEWDKAGAALERALRIEPSNAGIWHDLAQIRLQQRNFQQAASLAAKSNSLARDNNFVQVRNWRLIAVARRALGDEAGADAAEAQALALEP
jgi:tetratricopeptide (TPR) repeat protein